VNEFDATVKQLTDELTSLRTWANFDLAHFGVSLDHLKRRLNKLEDVERDRKFAAKRAIGADSSSTEIGVDESHEQVPRREKSGGVANELFRLGRVAWLVAVTLAVMATLRIEWSRCKADDRCKASFAWIQPSELPVGELPGSGVIHDLELRKRVEDAQRTAEELRIQLDETKEENP
jgi:hypothetical protein